jgi:hypothetical protein
MVKNTPLLFDPPHIIPPDVVLIQKCENCGKALESPYYIIVGIPPSPLMIEAFSCKSIKHEKNIEKLVMSAVQSEARNFKIDR